MKQSVLLCTSLSISLIMLTVWANAEGLEYYGIEDAIKTDLSVHHNIVLKFKEPAGHLDYQIGSKIYNLEAYGNFPFAECSSRDSGTGSVISCDFTGITSENDKLTLDFDTNGDVEKTDEVYRFMFDHSIPMPVDRVFATIKLPENGLLSESVANHSYYPPGGSIASDGRHIIIYWERENLTADDGINFSVLFNMPFLDPFLSYLIVSATIVIVASVLAAIFYIRVYHRPPKPESLIESVLNKDEKAVIAVLNKHGGSSGQKIIVRETDFSKAKVSRLVKSLRERSVVIVEPISGRENRVIIKPIKRAAEAESKAGTAGNNTENEK